MAAVGVVVVGGVRVSARRIPRGLVCHPSVCLGKPSKSSITSDDMLELWADHGAHVICLLCWARALVQQGRVHSRPVHLGAVASRIGGLIRHGGTQADGQLP